MDDIVKRLEEWAEVSDYTLAQEAVQEINRLRRHVHPSLMYPYAPENKDAQHTVRSMYIVGSGHDSRDIQHKGKPGDE